MSLVGGNNGLRTILRAFRLHEVFASRDGGSGGGGGAIFMVMDYAVMDLERFISRFGRKGGGVLTERGGLEGGVVKVCESGV